MTYHFLNSHMSGNGTDQKFILFFNVVILPRGWGQHLTNGSQNSMRHLRVRVGVENGSWDVGKY